MESSRVFPHPRPDLYDGEQVAAAGAISPEGARLLAASKALTRAGRLRGSGLDASARLARLLHFHGHALRNEAAGQWTAAAFFFRDIRRQAVRMDQRLDWDRLTVESPAGPLRGLVAREVLIDTHLAFHEGCLAGEWAAFGDRAAWHLAEVIRWIEWAGWDDASKVAFIRPLVSRLVGRAIQGNDWKRAIAAAAMGFSRLRDPESREQLASLEVARVVRLVNETKALFDVSATIATVKRLAEGAPTEGVYYEWLSQLHRLQMYHDAGRDAVASALEHAGRALAYDPGSTEASEALEALIARMKSLQEVVASIVAGLGFNQRLNAKGLALKAEADRGFGPLNRFRESAEAGQIATARRTAIAFGVWRASGLGEPTDPELPAVLLEQIERIWVRATDRPDNIAELARYAMSRDPRLQDVDPAKVARYLRRRIKPDDAVDPEPVGTPPPVPETGHPIAAKPRARWQRSEPLAYWLFAREGWWLKAQLVAALVLAALATGLGWRDANNRSARDRFYLQMIQAESRSDPLATIEAAEAFLDRSILGPDARDTRVRASYAEGLTRWLESEDPPSDVAARHLARYERLVLANDEEGT